MAGNDPTSRKPAEQVRQYAKALIVHLGPLEHEIGGPLSDGPAFGDDSNEIARAHRASKKLAKKRAEQAAAVPPELKAAWAAPSVTPAQLAQLAEQAKLALEQAAQLAGEPVAYFAGMIVPDRLVAKDSWLRKEPRYKIINGW